MAKYKNGINGPFSGKIGPVTGSSWLGVPYIKSNNSIGSGKEPSVKQLNQRMVFAMVSNWLKPMKGWVEMGYRNAPESKLPMNAAISFVMKHALRGTAPDVGIEYSQVVWTRGELLASVTTGFEVIDDGSTGLILRMEWLDALPSYYNRPEDEAVFVLYSPALSAFAVFEGDAVRRDGVAQLQMPWLAEGNVIHGWMFYCRDGGLSTSIYMGEVAG